MIRIQGLVKQYGELRAVDGLSLEVATGEIVALLGPNGAGKTSTVSCLVGLLQPDAGEIEICGVDALREPVAALNRSIEEGLFAKLVQEGKVSIPMTARYNLVERQWLADGALDDFVAKMGQQYQHFDKRRFISLGVR